MYDVVVYDIETLKGMFLLGVFIPEKGYMDFELSPRKNQIDHMFQVMENYREYYWVGYNSMRFDSQVVEYIYRNYSQWHDLSGEEICSIIYQKAQDVIHDANYNVLPTYPENELSFKQIDLFKIHHYDNKNRMVSLKRLEFEMDMSDIEEMPIHHGKAVLTHDEMEMIRSYCKNDIRATREFYNITIGDTDHPLYKGDNKIEMRLEIEKEYGIPCLNYSNARIGDEIIKKYYCEETGMLYRDLPKKGTFRKEIKLKHCIPPYIKFKTKQLRDFLWEAKQLTLKMDQDFVQKINFMGQTYTFAKGGLHNIIKGAVYESTEDCDIIDLDVSGYYPATIINNNFYPFHLGKAFLAGYSRVYWKRLELKPLAKKDNRIKGIVNGLKEAGNCPYGKSGDMDSWLYDRQVTLATCITGEMALLMMIESMELEGIKCIMANTDGATFLVPKNKRDRYEAVKEEWLKATTNELTYSLEEVEFKKLVFSSVNSYIGIKPNGEIKCKGEFLVDFELHKNKSSRIVNIALYRYYVDNIPVEETIKNHTNLFDFCIRAKSSKCFHYEGISRKTKTTNMYDKLIRYYISKEGERILKIKNPECETNAAEITDVTGEWSATVCNTIKNPTVKASHNIAYDYYIEQVDNIIYRIMTKGKKKGVKRNPLQINLFE